MRGNRQAMTGRELCEILGPLDADTVAAVLALEPAPAEIVQVREWMDADDAIRRTLKHPPSGVVARVCDMLASIEALATEER